MVAAADIRARVRRDVARLAHRGLGAASRLRPGGQPVPLYRAVPFEGTCLLTVDPATLLPTGSLVENGLPDAATARLTEIELGEPDVNKFTALARGPRPAAASARPPRAILTAASGSASFAGRTGSRTNCVPCFPATWAAGEPSRCSGRRAVRCSRPPTWRS